MKNIGSSLLGGLRVIRNKGAVAAGTSNITDATEVATKHNENFLFLFSVGAITATAVTVVKIQASTDGGSTYNDLAGTGILLVPSTDDGKTIAIEIVNPLPAHTHLKPYVARGTANAVLDDILTIVGPGKSEPVSLAGVHASSKKVISPAVGTAGT